MPPRGIRSASRLWLAPYAAFSFCKFFIQSMPFLWYVQGKYWYVFVMHVKIKACSAFNIKDAPPCYPKNKSPKLKECTAADIPFRKYPNI